MPLDGPFNVLGHPVVAFDLASDSAQRLQLGIAHAGDASPFRRDRDRLDATGWRWNVLDGLVRYRPHGDLTRHLAENEAVGRDLAADDG